MQFEEPPPSRLQQTIAWLLLKKVDTADLMEACEQTVGELDQLRQSFFAQLDELPQPVRDGCIHETQSLLDSLDGYLELVNACADYQLNFDCERLDYLAGQLSPTVARLNLDGIRFQQAALALRGPTTHPGINHLLSLWPNGDELLELEKERALSLLANLPGQDDWELEVRAFHEGYLEMLKAPLQEKILLSMGAEYQKLDHEMLWRRFSGAPSSLPWLNLLIHGGWLFSKGEIAASLMDRLVDSARLLLDEALADGQERSQEAVALLEQLGDWVELYSKQLGRLKPEVYEAMVLDVLELDEDLARTG